MSKKILDVAAITNELEGASLFFSSPAKPVAQKQSRPSAPKPVNEEKTVELEARNQKEIVRGTDTWIPRHHATTVSRHHETMIASIRTVVKVFGNKAAT